MRCLPLLLALALTPVQSVPPDTAARVILVKYSDGRTTTRILTPKGGSWTPLFPHRPDAPAQDGLRLHSLQIDHVMERDIVTLSVSLNYGMPLQHLVPVDTVTLTNGQSVRIEKLTQFGVDPITIAIGEAPPIAVVQPSASSVSPMVDIGVEVMRSDLPVYKVTLRNRGQIGIAALSYRAFRGGTVALNGRKKTNRNTTVTAPGETISFTVQTSPEDRGVMDRFEVSAVLWDDGSVDGDSALKTSEDSLAEGFVYQLRRVLSLLSDPNVKTIDALRSALEGLPIDSDAATSQQTASGSGVARTSFAMGQQIVKTAVLDDLGEFARSSSDKADTPAQAWIEGARVRYSEWLTRAVNNAPAAK